jgi:hypothetical protein
MVVLPLCELHVSNKKHFPNWFDGELTLHEYTYIHLFPQTSNISILQIHYIILLPLGFH